VGETRDGGSKDRAGGEQNGQGHATEIAKRGQEKKKKVEGGGGKGGKKRGAKKE